MESELTSGPSARALLFLSWLRSATLVGQALAGKYPTERDWHNAITDPSLHDELDAFAGVMRDVGLAASAGEVIDLEVLEESNRHYERAFESLRLFAERLRVNEADLIVLLTHALSA